jgi:cation transport ATPase
MMSEQTSKFVVAAEALLLAVPVTILFAVWAPDEMYRAPEYGGFENRVIAAIAGVTLISGWWLMVVFWRGGADALRTAHVAMWLVAIVGCFASLVGGVITWVHSEAQSLRYFGILAAGLPLLIPFIHLYIERRSRTAANKPLKEQPRVKHAAF